MQVREKYPRFPELLWQYMQEQSTDERGVTVQELRDRLWRALGEK